MNTKRIVMGLILPAIIGASAAFAQSPTLDKLKFQGIGGSQTLVSAADSNTSGAVVIPATYNGKPVTHVPNYAFQGRKGITSVTFPESLIEIGRDAFKGCTGIRSITIPTATKVVSYAFQGCTNLTSVTFQGTAALNPSAAPSFDGDLDKKYQAGGPGTYTRSAGSNTWTKQGSAAVCPTCGKPL